MPALHDKQRSDGWSRKGRPGPMALGFLGLLHKAVQPGGVLALGASENLDRLAQQGMALRVSPAHECPSPSCDSFQRQAGAKGGCRSAASCPPLANAD